MKMGRVTRRCSVEQGFDLVILGSGSTVFAAAIRAAELGKTAAMTEARTLGGTCVNRGCLPSKNLIEAARVYWEALQPRFPGLRPKGMELDFDALIAQKDELIAHYREQKYRSIVRDSDRIRVYQGQARFTPDRLVEVDGVRLRAAHYLLATGSRPLIPPVEGLERVPHLTSDLLTSGEPMELQELPRSLLILGGGYIALELGQMFHRLGAEVTILERGPRVLPPMSRRSPGPSPKPSPTKGCGSSPAFLSSGYARWTARSKSPAIEEAQGSPSGQHISSWPPAASPTPTLSAWNTWACRRTSGDLWW